MKRMKMNSQNNEAYRKQMQAYYAMLQHMKMSAEQNTIVEFFGGPFDGKTCNNSAMNPTIYSDEHNGKYIYNPNKNKYVWIQDQYIQEHDGN